MYVLITGASSGIGLEMARVFAQQKKDLILVARNKKALEELAQQIRDQYSVQVRVVSTDLTETNAAQALFDLTEARSWPVETLVNNAGFGDFSLYVDEKWERINSMVQLNITALLQLTRLYLPKMKASNSGNILNVASTAGFQPGPYMAVYYASKAFVLSFTEALHEELRGTGIKVSTLCPGPTESNFLKAANIDDVPLFKMTKLPTSKEVAIYGVDALHANQSVAIHGWLNFMLMQLSRFMPRSLIVKLVRSLQEKRK